MSGLLRGLPPASFSCPWALFLGLLSLQPSLPTLPPRVGWGAEHSAGLFQKRVSLPPSEREPPLRGEGSCGGGGAPRDSAGSGATEEGGPRGRGAGGRREAEQVKNAGQEGRHRFRGQGQGQRTVMQRRGPQGTGAGLVLTHGTRQFPGAFPCRPGPEPCDAVVGARGPPQHTCWLISGFSAPLSPGGEDKDALSFSLSSDG